MLDELRMACACKEWETALKLVEGTDWLAVIVPQVNRTGLLHKAVRNAPILLIEAMLKAGLDPNLAQERLLKTPLHYAVLHGRADLIPLLVKYGGDVNKEGVDRVTAMLWAADKNVDSELAQILVRFGANIHHTDHSRHWGCLHYAIRSEASFLLVDTMCQLGANPNALDIRNKSPLMYALEKSPQSLQHICTLLRYGGEIDVAISSSTHRDDVDGLKRELDKIQTVMALCSPRAPFYLQKVPSDVWRLLSAMLFS